MVNTEFFLLGFQGSQNQRNVLFCLLLVVYNVTICGNLLIIILVATSKILHTPMYFFISQLSVSDILLTTDIVPNLLHILLNNGAAITHLACIAQLYFFSAFEAVQCFFLTVMSYDRYVAICNPLHYTSIMTRTHCVKLTIFCWLVGCSVTLSDTVITSRLTFCGPNIIDHFFCDLTPLLNISCSDTFIVTINTYVIVVLVVLSPCIIIVISYINIIATILRIPSSTGRQKTFSTCGSHLTVVCIFYCALFCVYAFPMKGKTLTISKVLSLLYTVFTPLINPVIYSLRNKDIWKALSTKIFKKMF